MREKENILTLVNVLANFRCFLLVIMFCFVFVKFNPLKAQISSGGIPNSFADSTCLPQSNIHNITLPFTDNDSLLQIDSIQQLSGGPQEYHFGMSVKVDHGLTNAGTWEILPDSSRLWRLNLKSIGAYSNFLVFDDFFLPKGTKLFAYNEDHTQVLGAFTHKNNKPYGRFSLGPIIGESVILEYFESANTDTIAQINIATFIHSYRKATNNQFGEAASCNVNAMCESAWCNQRRSVAMLVTICGTPSHLSGSCSGALITNERRDLRPYFLTANHCLDGCESDWIFIFNYQSPGCSDPNTIPSTQYSISGATAVKASRCKSDFALLELSARPLGNYNTYYSGFDNRNNKPESGAVISHPKGDIKKIMTYSKKGKRRSIFIFDCTTKTWKIKRNKGTVETGSSGAPLFNENKLIVGQASAVVKSEKVCKKKQKAWYGRFDISWANGSSSSSRLRDWLNPHGTNNVQIVAMSGDEPCKVSYNFTNANDLHTSINIDGLTNIASAGTRTYNGVYEVTDQITAGNNVTIQNGTSVTFNAGNLIRLTPGFRAVTGSTFRATIGGCLRGCNTGVGKMGETEDPVVFVLSTDKINEAEDVNTFNSNTELNDTSSQSKDAFTIYPNPNTGMFTLNIKVMETQDIHIKIINTFAQEIYYEKLSQIKGTYNKQIDLSTYSKGIYNLQLLNSKGIRNKKIIKL